MSFSLECLFVSFIKRHEDVVSLRLDLECADTIGLLISALHIMAGPHTHQLIRYILELIVS